jgi:hypothetical protein
LMTDLSFKNSFPKPSSGKWTKTGPATQRLAIGFLNGILVTIGKKALGAIKFDTQTEGAFDDTFTEWNKTASKASKIAFCFLACSDSRMRVVILLVVDEVYRYLTMVFMKFNATMPERECGKPSPIQILASDVRSPIWTSRAHLSDLVAGTSPRVVLLWRYRGSRSFQDWIQEFPQDADFFQKSCQAASASLERRQRGLLSKVRYQALAMGDPDMPEHISRGIACRIAQSEKWGLAGGFELRYWQKHKDRVKSKKMMFLWNRWCRIF